MNEWIKKKAYMYVKCNDTQLYKIDGILKEETKMEEYEDRKPTLPTNTSKVIYMWHMHTTEFKIGN